MPEPKQKVANGTKLYVTKSALSHGMYERTFRSGVDQAAAEGVQERYVYLKPEDGTGYHTQLLWGRDVFVSRREALENVLTQVARKKAALRKQQEKLDVLATRCRAELDK
jgi:hypothetical protein